MTLKQFKEMVEELKKEWVRSLLIQSSGNISHSARLAKVDRSNFIRMMRNKKISKFEFLPENKGKKCTTK